MDPTTAVVALALLVTIIAWAYTQPSPERQRAALRSGLLVLLVLAALAYFRSLLMPFVLPVVIAYLMDPLLDRVEARGWPRVVGIVAVYVLIIGALVAAFVLLLPPILTQIGDLARQLAAVQWERAFDAAWIGDRLIGLVQHLPGPDTAEYKARLIDGIHQIVGQWKGQWSDLAPSLQKVSGWLTERATSVAQWLFTTFAGLAWLLLLPITLWYCLADYDKMRRRAWYLVPPEKRPMVGELAGAMNRAIGSYLRGYALLCLMVGVTTTVLMLILEAVFGSSYALIVGVVAGLTYFIPYVGSITSVVFGTLAVFFTGGMSTGETLIAFIVLQTSNSIYDNIVNPRIIGQHTGVHPVLVMFGLLAAGKLLGLVGIIIATPLLLMTKVVLEYYFPRLAESIPDDQNPDLIDTDVGAKVVAVDPAEAAETQREAVELQRESEDVDEAEPEQFATDQAKPSSPQAAAEVGLEDDGSLPPALDDDLGDEPFAPRDSGGSG